MDNVSDKKIVDVQTRDGIVTIEYTTALEAQVRLAYNLSESDDISKDMIVAFIKHEVNDAISRADQQKSK